MSYILVNGCSHTVGFELEEEIGIELNQALTNEKREKVEAYRQNKAWPYLVGKKLNLDVTNIATVGASNDKIVYETIDYLENNKSPALVILGLSSTSRTLLSFEQNKIVFSYAHFSGIFNKMFRDTPDEEKLHSWAFCMTKYFYSEQFQNYLFHHYLSYITTYSQFKNIPLLLAPTMNFSSDLAQFTSYSVDKTMEEVCIANRCKRAKGHHWLSEGHEKWATCVLDNIKKIYGN